MTDIAANYATALRQAFEAPVDVAGLSTGGSVALQLAIDHPELVKRLVVVASAYRLGAPARRSQRRMATLAAAGRRRQVDWALGRSMGRSRASSLAAGALYWLAGPLLFGTAADPSDMIATIEAEDGFDVGQRLGAIKVPTLVVGGAKDQFYQANGERLIAETAARIHGARLVLYERRGHAGTFLDRRLPRDVLAFLAEDGT
jgi:pimeloyl-ACP methyl ester carboxylesterase